MNPVSKLFRLVYWPICRAYARSLGDRPADATLRCLCSPPFLMGHRFWPDFVQPHRFSEKLWNRMLHDRDPILTLISDKLLVRDYITKKVGQECLIPLLWSGDRPEEIPFDELPSKFVIKANHGCGYVIIVKDKKKLDRTETVRELNHWLGENFGRESFLGIAWAYYNIKPCIVIESFIEENGKAPVDYKFYCFSGRVEVLTLHYDRFEGHKFRSYDRNFDPHELEYDLPQWKGELMRPPNFDEMVRLVESMADGFDFMRVDIYSVEDKIYFSELTPYPGGTNTRFLPERQDHILGGKWKCIKGLNNFRNAVYS